MTVTITTPPDLLDTALPNHHRFGMGIPWFVPAHPAEYLWHEGTSVLPISPPHFFLCVLGK